MALPAYSESDLLPLSALQHLAFCERQCALIHVEQIWQENRFTAEGRVMHDRVHKEDREWRGSTLIVRGLRLRSLALGLSGMADVVEFEGMSRHAESLPMHERVKNCRVRPVEYKRGKPKLDSCDEVQLCAQAMCLEEMLQITIDSGDLFYGAQRQRHDVLFTPQLREQTEALSRRLHDLIAAGVTPPARRDKRCDQCSLLDDCMPDAARGGGVERYLAHAFDAPGQ